MAKFKYIGQSMTRPDAISKAIGKAQYLDDIRLPGLLHAAILHPEYAHADILSIDTAEAAAMPGVVQVVTGRDCKTLYGDNISDISPMAVNKVRHIGDHVAAVIATTKRQATDALKKIKVEYKPLPVYTDARQALAKDAILIHENAENYWHLPGLGAVPGTNIANTYRLKKGDVEQGFAEADVVVEGEFVYPHGSCAAIEPHGAIVRFNEDGTIDAWSSSICPFIIRDDLAHAYHKSSSMVRVRIPEIGGCFGYKSDITVEQTVAWIASHVPGRPVKWVASRREDFTSTLIGHGFRHKMKIGAKKDGTLVAIQADILHSTGAFSDTGIHVCNAATHNCTGPYEFPHALLESKCVYTNTPPSAPSAATATRKATSPSSASWTCSPASSTCPPSTCARKTTSAPASKTPPASATTKPTAPSSNARKRSAPPSTPATSPPKTKTTSTAAASPP
jgi:CO/xanthine dehydrogenase Mo-binding subunit